MSFPGFIFSVVLTERDFAQAVPHTITYGNSTPFLLEDYLALL